MTSSTPPPPASARPGTHRTRTLVLVAVAAAVVAGLLGLVIGGLGGALLSSGLGGGGSRTDQNISEGCAILDRLEEDLPLQEDSLDLSDPLLFELGAAGNHFMAAGAGDTDGELWTAGNELVAGMSRLDTDLTNQGLEDAAAICKNA